MRGVGGEMPQCHVIRGTNITTAGVAAARSQLRLGGLLKGSHGGAGAGDTGQGQWTGIPG